MYIFLIKYLKGINRFNFYKIYYEKSNTSNISIQKYLLKFKNFIKINHSKTHILSKSDKLINWLYKDQKHYNFALAINDHK